MAIHTRRPQDPPNLPKITIGAPPPDAVPGVEGVAKPAARKGSVEGGADTVVASTPSAERASSARSGRRQSWVVREGWFAVMLLSVVPMGAVLVMPASAVVLLGIAAMFLVAGVVLFLRK